MAVNFTTNGASIALRLLTFGLGPYVEAKMKTRHGNDWRLQASRAGGSDLRAPLDAHGLLKTRVRLTKLHADRFKSLPNTVCQLKATPISLRCRPEQLGRPEGGGQFRRTGRCRDSRAAGARRTGGRETIRVCMRRPMDQVASKTRGRSAW